jgi:chromosome segregation ATPase
LAKLAEQQKPSPTQPIQEEPAQPSPETSSAQPMQFSDSTKSVVTELEKIKATAAKELAERQKNTPGEPQLQTGPQAPVPLAQSTEPDQAVIEPVLKPATKPLPPTPPAADEGTKKLLEQAQQLESELSQLRKGIVTKREEAEKEKVKAEHTVEQQEAQVQQLISDRTVLSTKVNELTSAHSEEINKQDQLEKKLKNLTADYEQKLRVVMDERDKLATIQSEGQNKAVALESQIQTMGKEFDQKLQQIQIEKTNLLDQVKKLQEAQSQWQQQLEQSKKHVGENTQLKADLDTVKKDRDELKERYTKLEFLVNDLRDKTKAVPVRTEAIEPKEAKPAVEEKKEEPPAVRVVKPQPAVGKMAPSLTSAPNVINGIVKDTNGMLLSNVILVVKDSNGQPVRALKSNKIGQFAISTPLPNGTYTIELESAGHAFDILQVEVAGKVMPPIEIRAIS